MSAGIPYRKYFFNAKKNVSFCITCGIWAEKTSKSGKKFSAGFSKMHSTLPVESLRAKPIFEFFSYFFSFSQFERFFFDEQNLGQGCQNSTVYVLRTISRKWFILENSYFFYHFRTRSQKISAFCRKIFHRVVKNAFNLSRGKFWGERFFYILVCFKIFRFSSEIFSVLAKKIGAVLSRLYFKCPEEHVQEKLPVEKTHNFFYQFRVLRWHFSSFRRKYFSRVVKIAIYVSITTF